MSDSHRSSRRSGTRWPRSSSTTAPRPSVSSTTSSAAASSTPPSWPRAGASCGWPRTTARPWPPAWSPPSWPRSSAAGWPTRPTSGRCWPPSCAASPVRRPPRGRDRRAGARPGRPGHGGRRRGPPGSLAVDADGATTGLVLLAGPEARCSERSRSTARGPHRPDPERRGRRRRCGGDVGRRTGARARDLDRWTALGLALTSADLVGVMRGAVDLAVEYAQGRRQYGQPIGSFQAVQHLLADAFVLMEGSRSARAARGLGGRRPPAGGGAHRRRAWPRPTAPAPPASSARPSIQVHGGIGNTWECLAHVYLRRALRVERHARRRGAQPRPGARPPRDRRPRWTSVTPPRRRSSASGSGSGWSTTTRSCPPRRPTTRTGPARPPGTSRSTTGASSALTWSKAIGGQELPSVYDVIIDEELAAGRGPAPAQPRLPGRGHPRARQRRDPGPLPARHRQRARALVPGVQRARRRFRPGVAAHPRRARRRRVRHRRPQGLDQLLRRRRLVPRAGPHRPRRARSTRASPPSPCRWTSRASSSDRSR